MAKPTVFVFPTFLAVGGVERNTIDVISRLRDDYDFVVVTFERLAPGQGSLHHQFAEHCKAIYDLAEISDQAAIPAYLEFLRDRHRPELVWICNGCPWLAANLDTVRAIFHKAAIVDQQVYDTAVGWVNLYHARNPALLQFDGHIAINSKIRDLFVQEIGIDPAKVDLIYPIISLDKRARALAASRAELRAKFGLHPDRLIVSTVGRLSAQKRPVDYVEMVGALVRQGGCEVDFLMVGDGELAGEVDERIAQLSLGSRIRRIPHVENVFELARAIDGIVFVSAFEGLPIALLEALAVGTPGLCTDVGDISVVFARYGNGMIFDEIGNPKSHLGNFAQFIANHAELKREAEATMDGLAQDFSLEAAETRYLECFRSARQRRTA